MSQVFMGNDAMKVDQKGRVAIPARFYHVLCANCPQDHDSVGVMLTPERSIMVMPSPVFIEQIERWAEFDGRDAQGRQQLNVSAAMAEQATLDGQRRIRLNPLMMEACNIRAEGGVIVVGCVTYMQIFEEAAFRAMISRSLPPAAFGLPQYAPGQYPQQPMPQGYAPPQPPMGYPQPGYAPQGYAPQPQVTYVPMVPYFQQPPQGYAPQGYYGQPGYYGPPAPQPHAGSAPPQNFDPQQPGPQPGYNPQQPWPGPVDESWKNQS